MKHHVPVAPGYSGGNLVSMTDDYLAINRANWDSRVPHHLTAYDLDKFRTDPTFISGVVTFDLPRLGSVEGLDIVHLQCHIGTDTLSLKRLGAKSVSGVDFSPRAVEAARTLATEFDLPANFIESDVYDAPVALEGGTYDMVYTGIGALCWIPDIARWAQVVAALLRPGGRLFIREGHPMLWALSDAYPDGTVRLEYPYFESAGTGFHDETSYVEHTGTLDSPDSVNFNHGLGEIFTALQASGLTLTHFEEHQSVPYCALGELMEEVGGGEWRLKEKPERLPASYTLQATK